MKTPGKVASAGRADSAIARTVLAAATSGWKEDLAAPFDFEAVKTRQIDGPGECQAGADVLQSPAADDPDCGV